MNKTFTFTGTFLVLLLALFQLKPVGLKAQTTLAVGDLLFTGFNANPNAATGDTFSFMLLKGIDSGTKISFSDRGFINGAWFAAGSTEASVTWTAGSGVAMGTEVLIYGLNVRRYDPVSATLIPCGTLALTEGSPANGLSLPNVGDQVFAYQGGNGSITGTGVVLIAGLNFFWCNSNTTFNSWNGAGCTSSQSSSSLPIGLSATGATASAFYTGRFSPTLDPAWGKFNCPDPMPTTAAALRSAIMNQSNWTLGTTTTVPFALPARCNFSSIALPIRLLSFEVNNEGNTNQLNWSSTKETLGDKFVIERSQDGVSFAYLSEVPARNTDIKNAYQYIDPKPLSGANYYRLLMVNIDGSREYSKVLSARLQDAEDAHFRLYPNPFTNEISLEVLSDIGHQPKVKITDITGREVARYYMEQTSLNISLTQLSAGVYYIQYRDSKRSKVWKVMKQ